LPEVIEKGKGKIEINSADALETIGKASLEATTALSSLGEACRVVNVISASLGNSLLTATQPNPLIESVQQITAASQVLIGDDTFKDQQTTISVIQPLIEHKTTVRALEEKVERLESEKAVLIEALAEQLVKKNKETKRDYVT
jgi:hypothetical protein